MATDYEIRSLAKEITPDDVRKIHVSVQDIDRELGPIFIRMTTPLIEKVFSVNLADRSADVSGAPSDPDHAMEGEGGARMSESEVRRLEDRIEAVNREGQLRLDTAIARIDGKLEAVLGAVNTMKAENAGAAGALRAENSAIRDTLAALNGSVAEIRADGRSTRTTVIVTAVAIVLGLAGVLIGLKQVWIGGLQVGQTVQTTAK